MCASLRSSPVITSRRSRDLRASQRALWRAMRSGCHRRGVVEDDRRRCDARGSVAVTPRLVGLVADDLTGATDSAVQFAEAGWAAHLLRGPGVGAGLADGPELAGAGLFQVAVVT